MVQRVAGKVELPVPHAPDAGLGLLGPRRPPIAWPVWLLPSSNIQHTCMYTYTHTHSHSQHTHKFFPQTLPGPHTAAIDHPPLISGELVSPAKLAEGPDGWGLPGRVRPRPHCGPNCAHGCRAKRGLRASASWP